LKWCTKQLHGKLAHHLNMASAVGQRSWLHQQYVCAEVNVLGKRVVKLRETMSQQTCTECRCLSSSTALKEDDDHTIYRGGRAIYEIYGNIADQQDIRPAVHRQHFSAHSSTGKLLLFDPSLQARAGRRRNCLPAHFKCHVYGN
jgi:hypothetical protein